MERNEKKNIVTRGAEGGAVLGLMFVAMFAAWVGSTSALMSLVCMILFVAVPIVAYKLMRRTYIESYGLLTFSAIWLEGILMFIFGSLILAIAAFVFFRWISPDFISLQVQLVIDLYREIPEFSDFADTLERMREYGMLPRPIDMTMSMVWLTAFTGSLLSLVLAAIVKGRKIPPRNSETTEA